MNPFAEKVHQSDVTINFHLLEIVEIHRSPIGVSNSVARMASRINLLRVMGSMIKVLVFLLALQTAIEQSEAYYTPTSQRRTLPPHNGGMFGKRSVLLPITGNLEGGKNLATGSWRPSESRSDTFMGDLANRCLLERRDAGK